MPKDSKRSTKEITGSKLANLTTKTKGSRLAAARNLNTQPYVTPKPRRASFELSIPLRTHAIRQRKALSICQADEIRKTLGDMYPEDSSVECDEMSTEEEVDQPGSKRPRKENSTLDLTVIQNMLLEAKSERAAGVKTMKENGGVLKSLQAEQLTMRRQQEESKISLQKLEQKMSIVEELKASVAGFEVSMNDVQDRLSKNEKNVGDLMQEFRSHCNGAAEGCKGLRTVSHHSEEIALARRVAVVTSIPKIDGESQAQLRIRVDTFMKEVIKLNDQEVATVMIQQCHRQIKYGRDPKDDVVEIVFTTEQKKDHFFKMARRNMTYGSGHRVRLCIPKCLSAKNRRLGNIAAKCRELNLHATVRYTQDDEILAIFMRKDGQDEWLHITQFKDKYPEYKLPDYKVSHGVE